MILIFIGVLIILCMIPIFWSNDLVLDKVKITEEYYKTIVNLLLLLIGFYFFEFLIRKNNEKQLKKKIEDFSKRLSTSALQLENGLSNIADQNGLRLKILTFATLLKLVKLNSDFSARSQIIDMYLIFSSFNVESALQSLEYYCNGESIDTGIIQNSIKILRDYFFRIKENSTANTWYS